MRVVRWITQAFTAAVAACVVVPFIVATPAHATDNGIWSVDPGGGSTPGARTAFNYTLKPDQVFQDIVSVANLSDEALTLDLYATDAYNTTLDGSFALLEDGEDPQGAGTWITLATNQITLEPGTQAEIPFQIAIPLDARPGDHAAGIIAQNAEFEVQEDADGVGVQLRRRIASRVYVRVDGPLQPDLAVTEVAVAHDTGQWPLFAGDAGAAVSYEIKNTGNTRITPTASLEIEGILGGTVMAFDDRELRELLPGSSLIITERFTGLPPLNRLSAKVSVRAEGPVPNEIVEATGSRSFWVVSWYFVGLLVLIPILFWMWRRERRRGDPLPPEDDPGPEPTIPERELVAT